MDRNERRALLATMRKQALAWPEQLALLPESEWPSRREGGPVNVWRSRKYLVAQYREPPFAGLVEVRRLTVNRVTMRSDGRWEDGISWDELMRCKRESGHGDWYGVEVYPRERDVVNDANMRHLWLLSEPLPIGWFDG